MADNIAPWPCGLIACDNCGTDLKPDLSSVTPSNNWRCPTCNRWWKQSEILFLSGHTSPEATGLTGQSRAFFDTHALATPNRALHDQYVLRMEAMANYDYLTRSVELAASTRAKTVVEIGCGDGRGLHALQSNNPTLNLVGIEVAREKLISAANTISGDAITNPTQRLALIDCHGDRIPIGNDTVDLVLMLHVLHHAGNLRLVGEAARVLRPGGTLFVVDLSDRNPLVLMLRFAWRYLPSNLRNRFDREYTVAGNAPPVKLVNPSSLNATASMHGLQLCATEDDGLFAFLFVYFLIAIPALRSQEALILLNYLRMIERLLLIYTPARHLAVGVARVWTKPS